MLFAVPLTVTLHRKLKVAQTPNNVACALLRSVVRYR
jgi:hypothetical protein